MVKGVSQSGLLTRGSASWPGLPRCAVIGAPSGSRYGIGRDSPLTVAGPCRLRRRHRPGPASLDLRFWVGALSRLGGDHLLSQIGASQPSAAERAARGPADAPENLPKQTLRQDRRWAHVAGRVWVGPSDATLSVTGLNCLANCGDGELAVSDTQFQERARPTGGRCVCQPRAVARCTGPLSPASLRIAFEVDSPLIANLCHPCPQTSD